MTTTVAHATAPTEARHGVLAWYNAAPATLRWGTLLTLAWAVGLPLLNFLSGMVRWEPNGSEGHYWTGMLVAIGLYVAGAALACWFAIRGSRIAQIVLLSAHLMLGVLAITNLTETGFKGVLPPPNIPLDAPVHAGIVWVVTTIVSLASIALIALPEVWRHTRGRGLLPRSHVTG